MKGNMSSNRETGDAFQRLARSTLQKLTGLVFELEVPIPLGRPPRNHKFDFASADRRIVGESKCLVWTVSDNAPAAKLETVRGALRDLQNLPEGTKTFIVMKPIAGARTPSHSQITS